MPNLTLQRRALSHIDDLELREATLDVFTKISQDASVGKVDLVVLAARRLACVYQVLVAAKMLPISCPVISDRVFDLSTESANDRDGSELAGAKHIVVIDDCVVTGRTLSTLVDQVAKQADEGATVQAIALCVDKDQVVPGLMNKHRVDVKCERSTTHTREFSLAIAKTLFTNLVPYFSDFLTTRRMELSARTYERLLNHQYWTAVDTTPQLLREPGIAAYTLLPSAEVIERLEQRIGKHLYDLVALLKVRVLVRFNGSTREFVITPLGLIHAVQIETLDNALRAIAAHVHNQDLLRAGWEDWQPVAKQRLLQGFFSVVILREYWEDMQDKCDDLPQLDSSAIDKSALEIHFGQKRVNSLLSAIDKALNLDQPVVFETTPVETPTRQHIKDDLVGVADSLKIASQVLEIKENIPDLPQRTQPGIVRVGAIFVAPFAGIFGFINELEGRSHNGSYDWLNVGLAFPALKDLLQSPQSAVLVSLALDVCNDLGVVVPTTHFNKDRGYVDRRYRIGENAYLGVELARPPQETEAGDLKWLDDQGVWLTSYFFNQRAAFEDVLTVLQPTEKPTEASAFVAMLTSQRDLAAPPRISA